MSDWKDKIEAQISELRNSCYLLDEYSEEIGVSEHAASMQALLDVAVAADDVAQLGGLAFVLNCDIDDDGWMDSLIAALDKLREVGDE